MIGAAGVKVVRLPARSPNLNAYAERFVLSTKSECLERMVLLGERHLRWALSACLRHYHRERNHQGLDNTLIDGISLDTDGLGPVARCERLGGLLSFYYREAA
jgi:putative transposase